MVEWDVVVVVVAEEDEHDLLLLACSVKAAAAAVVSLLGWAAALVLLCRGSVCGAAVFLCVAGISLGLGLCFAPVGAFFSSEENMARALVKEEAENAKANK